MSKAEERALKAYPNIKIGKQHIDQSPAREVYVQGYEQAVKDTALTWEDIQCIVKIADQIVGEDRGKFMDLSDEDYYKEVLDRYVKQSEKP